MYSKLSEQTEKLGRMPYTWNPMNLKAQVVLMSWAYAILRNRILPIYLAKFKINDVDENLHKNICLSFKTMSAGLCGFYTYYQDTKGFTEKFVLKNKNKIKVT